MPSTIYSIPIKLVLSSIDESEVSGSGIVTPTHRRRNHGIPVQHPHRNRRKVSAPPELQPHFGGAYLQGHHQGMQHFQGANPDHNADIHNTEYIINLSSNKAPGSEGLYSGSDSGVPSEYSSWAAPVSGGIRDVNSPDDTVTLSGSLDDIDDHHNSAPHNENKFYQQSDSDCERINDYQFNLREDSLEDGDTGGITNQAYLNTETAAPLVLSVNGPPPFNRIPTESSMASMAAPSPSLMGVPQARQRTNSMVLQFNMPGQQQNQMLPVSDVGNLQGGRSVSMVSLNALNVPQQNLYPNLPSDTQSIYSEVNPYGPPQGYLGNLGPAGNIGNAANLPPGMGLKMMEGLQHVGGNGGSGIMLANNQEGIHGHSDPNEPDEEPLGTPEEKKKAWFKFTLSENLSTMYAVFLFMLGIVIYLADTFSGHDSAVAEGFNIYLIVTQLLWLFYVHIDVRKYINTISRTLDEARSKVSPTEQVQLEPTGDGHFQLRINLPEPRKTIPQYYGFTSGRHGGSLYLKIGATVFCFGSLIHQGLNLGQKILYMTESDPHFMGCTCTTDIVMSVLQPVYGFYQLFFIFKYSNLIINRRRTLSRFGLMHCISSSLCFWFYAILQETLLALFSKKKKDAYGDNATTYAPPSAYGSSAYNKALDDDEEDYPVYSGTKIAKTAWSINYGCEKTTDLTKMINLTTPYLYPFTIEFNILIVGLWIILWENIGHTERHTHIPSVEVTYEEDNSKNFTSNLIIYVDCHSSNRGLFAGLLMTVATVVSIILFFIFTASEANVEFGRLVNGYSEIILLTAMGFTCLAAFNSVRKLDVNSQHISSVDDILLYMCLPCIFLYAFLSMVPSLVNGETLFVMVSILQVTQVILQTALIADGLRRCSNTTYLQHKKPGREVVTFLVVANVAMWLLETFEIKSESGNHQKYDYYGKELWTMLSHMTLPLALFYRFHSSVCLADMWKVSFEPEE
ncbi:unnamed protein product, partial [Meganyctiphanes norvegica]